MALTPSIDVGDEIIWLDPVAFKRGEFKVGEGSLSAQCDGCGADVAETAVVKRSGVVKCECGAEYVVNFEE